MARRQQPYQLDEQPGVGGAQLVERHAPLVKRIAHHLLARLPDSVQLEDLIQSGLEGLLEAANSYDAGKGASFETFAAIRIRGAMLDEMRRGDWSPRSVHRNARRLAEAHSQLESALGRPPSDTEVAEQLDVPVADYQSMARDTLSARLFSLDEPTGGEIAQSRADNYADTAEGPEHQVARQQAQQRLAEAIKTLPERDQLLLSLYYREELNLKEIGQVLGVSESRVSQLHSQAALKLRSRLLE